MRGRNRIRNRRLRRLTSAHHSRQQGSSHRQTFCKMAAAWAVAEEWAVAATAAVAAAAEAAGAAVLLLLLQPCTPPRFPCRHNSQAYTTRSCST